MINWKPSSIVLPSFIEVCFWFYLPHYAVAMSSSLQTIWTERFCLRSNTECIPECIEKPPTAVTACIKHYCISCRCLNQMEKDGLSVDDVFSQCVFRQDERDMVLKAMHIVQPDYHPSLNANTNQCSPALVQDFYTQVSQAGVHTVLYGLFSLVI